MGIERPSTRMDMGQHLVMVTLKVFLGEAFHWIEWIGIFCSLVHQNIQDVCREANCTYQLSVRCVLKCHPKQMWGERGLQIRISTPKGDLWTSECHACRPTTSPWQARYTSGNPAWLNRFAERVRRHLIDLSRRRESSKTDVIGQITQRLQSNIHLTLNNGRGTGLERLQIQ